MERFTISLEEKLAEEFDGWIAARGYSNRSEAVRDLLRAELGRTQIAEQQSLHCVASLSYVFNHHERELTARLAEIQHAHHDLTVSAMHAHLDHDHCLETVILKGPTAAVQALSDAICAERGVHHGKLNLISVDLHAPHRHRKPVPGKRGKKTAIVADTPTSTSSRLTEPSQRMPCGGTGLLIECIRERAARVEQVRTSV